MNEALVKTYTYPNKENEIENIEPINPSNLGIYLL